MAITTFAELKTAITDWSDASDVSAYLDDFVTLATSALNRGTDNVPALRCSDMETIANLTPVSNVCTLPADYLVYRRVVEKASIRRELTYITPSVADTDYPDRAAGLANNFTIVGSSLYMFPLSSNVIELTYYAAVPNLSVSNTTNWLLTKHPNIYLHACLMQLGMFRRDDDLTQRSAQILASLVGGLNNEDMLSNYAYAPSRPRGVVVV